MSEYLRIGHGKIIYRKIEQNASRAIQDLEKTRFKQHILIKVIICYRAWYYIQNYFK
jgi:hypothetical protein